MDALKSAAVACVNKNSAVRSKSRKARRYYAGVLALLGALSLAGCYGAPLSPGSILPASGTGTVRRPAS